MKQVLSCAKEVLTLVSLTTIMLCPANSSSNTSLPDTNLTPNTLPDHSQDDPIESPARPHKMPAPDSSRINRKPAVEPRVYMESADSKTGFIYFDYADQKPTREQSPPEK